MVMSGILTRIPDKVQTLPRREPRVAKGKGVRQYRPEEGWSQKRGSYAPRLRGCLKIIYFTQLLSTKLTATLPKVSIIFNDFNLLNLVKFNIILGG